MAFTFLKQSDVYSWKPNLSDTTYNFSNVGDEYQRIRLAASVDLLYVRANAVSGAPSELITGVQSRPKRSIRFFDNQAAAVVGTGAEPVTYIEPGGAAAWKWVNGQGARARYYDRTIPVPERNDERIYCKPGSRVLNFGPYVPIIWHEMTHIFTMLYHGTWSQHRGFQQPELPENQAWQSFIHRLQLAAPELAKDPITGEPDFVGRQSSDWVCNCGVSSPA